MKCGTQMPCLQNSCVIVALVLKQESWAIPKLTTRWGVANPRSWGRGGRRGSEMVPFERALVSSYRPSIVTFRLSLCVSEILPLFLLQHATFLHPASIVSSKFSHVPLGVGGWPFGYEEWRCCANCPCNQFPRFPTQSCGPDPPTLYERMDRRTSCNRNTALRTSASRGKKNWGLK